MIEAKCFRFGMLSSCFRHVFSSFASICAMQITWRQWVNTSSRFNLRLIELHGDGFFFVGTDSAIIKVDFKSNNWAVFVCHGRHQTAVPLVQLVRSSIRDSHPQPHTRWLLETIYTNKNDAIEKQTKCVLRAPLRYIPCACEQSDGGGCGGGDAGIFFWLLLLTDFHQYFRYFFHVSFVLCASRPIHGYVYNV